MSIDFYRLIDNIDINWSPPFPAYSQLVRRSWWSLKFLTTVFLNISLCATEKGSWKLSMKLFIVKGCKDRCDKWVSVKCGPDTCGWRMRMGKCGWENEDRKIRMEKCGQKNADGKMRIEKKKSDRKNCGGSDNNKKMSLIWTIIFIALLKHVFVCYKQ